MIFIDSNIPMYVVGRPHANKDVAIRLLERYIGRGDRLVSDVEVLQEILHRYAAIRRLDAIQPAFDALLGIVDHVYPVEPRDVDKAKQLLFGVSALSARDALHLAIMQRYEVTRILSFDEGFDSVVGIERLAVD